MNEQIKQYFKDHWIAMAVSVASSGIVFLISLITIFTNFRLDYFALKQSVQANTTSNGGITTVLQQMTNKLTQVDQKVTDDHEAIMDLHRYFFSTTK